MVDRASLNRMDLAKWDLSSGSQRRVAQWVHRSATQGSRVALATYRLFTSILFIVVSWLTAPPLTKMVINLRIGRRKLTENLFIYRAQTTPHPTHQTQIARGQLAQIRRMRWFWLRACLNMYFSSIIDLHCMFKHRLESFSIEPNQGCTFDYLEVSFNIYYSESKPFIRSKPVPIRSDFAVALLVSSIVAASKLMAPFKWSSTQTRASNFLVSASSTK